MKEKNAGGCMLSLPLVLIMVLVGMVMAGAAMALVSSSFGKGFAEGGGRMNFELFSDDVSATNHGDGITIAANDSQIGDVSNTVTKTDPQREAEAALMQLCLPALFIGLIIGAYVYLSSKGDGYYV